MVNVKCLICSLSISSAEDKVSVFTNLSYSHQSVISRLQDILLPFSVYVNSDIICRLCFKLFTDLERHEKEVRVAKLKVTNAYDDGRKNEQLHTALEGAPRRKAGKTMFGIVSDNVDLLMEITDDGVSLFLIDTVTLFLYGRVV